MKFPILIHLLNNKANHIVSSFNDLPFGNYFKIIRTGINPLDTGLEIEVDYRRFDEPVSKEVAIDEPPQEDNESSVTDSSDDGTSISSEDSIGTSV